MTSTSNAALRKESATPESLTRLREQGWSLVPSRPSDDAAAQKLVREYKFKNFVEAWGFMSRVALWAEKLNVRRPPAPSLPPFSFSGPWQGPKLTLLAL